MPSRIALIISRPDIPAAAFATGPGACQSTTRCRCAAGDLHEATVLSYSERGRTRFVMLPPAEVAAVAAAVDRYRTAEAELAATGEAGRAALIGRLAARRGRR